MITLELQGNGVFHFDVLSALILSIGSAVVIYTAVFILTKVLRPT